MQYRTLKLVFFVSSLLVACSPDQQSTDNTAIVTEPSTETASGTTIPRYDIEDFMSSTRYSGASFSPDNSKILVSNNSTGIFNVYTINVDGMAAASGIEIESGDDGDVLNITSMAADAALLQ